MKVDNILIIPDKQNIEESLQLAETYHCGFEYNDFFLPDVLDNRAVVQETIRFYKNLGKLPEYCTSHGAFLDVTVFSDDARIREVSDYRVEQSLDIASELGAQAVIFHTNFVPNFHLEIYYRSFVDRNYEYWSKKLEKYPDMNIYIENMFDMDWTLIAALAERFKGVEHFGVCFDYAHAHVFGDENRIDDWVNALAPYVKHMHINDNDFQSDLHLALGDGKIDWKHFCEQYEQYFAPASVLIETKDMQNIRKSLAYMAEL